MQALTRFWLATCNVDTLLLRLPSEILQSYQSWLPEAFCSFPNASHDLWVDRVDELNQSCSRQRGWFVCFVCILFVCTSWTNNTLMLCVWTFSREDSLQLDWLKWSVANSQMLLKCTFTYKSISINNTDAWTPACTFSKQPWLTRKPWCMLAWFSASQRSAFGGSRCAGSHRMNCWTGSLAWSLIKTVTKSTGGSRLLEIWWYPLESHRQSQKENNS